MTPHVAQRLRYSAVDRRTVGTAITAALYNIVRLRTLLAEAV